MVSELLSGYLSGIIGRTKILKLGGIIGSLGFIGNKFSPIGLKSIFLFIKMMGYSSTFNVLYIYYSDIIPSTIRSTVCVINKSFFEITPTHNLLFVLLISN